MKIFLIPFLLAAALTGCTPDIEIWIFNNTNDTITLVSGCGSVEIKKLEEDKFRDFCSTSTNFEIISKNNHWKYARHIISITAHPDGFTSNRDDFIKMKRFSLTPKYYLRLQLENDGKLFIVPLKKNPPIGIETPQLKGFPIYPNEKPTN